MSPNCLPKLKRFVLLQAIWQIKSLGFGGVDLLSLDGRLAVRCCNTSLPYREVKRFLRLGRWVYKVHRALSNICVGSLHFYHAFALFGGSWLCEFRCLYMILGIQERCCGHTMRSQSKGSLDTEIRMSMHKWLFLIECDQPIWQRFLPAPTLL